MTDEAREIAGSLTRRPALALRSWPPRSRLSWMQVVERARLPKDKQAMSYRAVLTPLEQRGLAQMVFGGSYDPSTGAFEPKRYRLTAKGLAVRAVLMEEADVDAATGCSDDQQFAGVSADDFRAFLRKDRP